MVTGNVFEAAGGASGGTVVIAGGIGATGAASASLYARVTVGTSASFGITPAPTATTISGSAYQYYTAENLTATATSDTLVITLPASTTIRFILNQFEQGKCITPTIITAGATATRQKQFTQMTGLDTAPWFNPNQGTIIVECTPIANTGQASVAGLFVAGSTGSFPTDAYYLQTNASSNAPNAFVKGNNVANNISTLSGVFTGRKTSLGMIYRNGVDVRCFAGPMATTNSAVAMTNTATGIVNFTVGAFAANSLHFNGWISKIRICKKALALKKAAPFTIGGKTGNTERGIICGGQSNIEGYFSSATSLTNGGERAGIALLDSVWGTSTRNWLINGTTGGTSYTAWQGTGTAIVKWKAVAEAFVRGGGSIHGIIWDQGESNIGNTVSTFKTAYQGIFDDMIAYLASLGQSNVKICIQALGRYLLNNTSTHNTNCSYHRQAYQELVAENSSTLCLAPEKYHQPLVDNLVHLTDAGYASQAPLALRKLLKFSGESVSGGVDGPAIIDVQLAGNTWTAELSHDVGGTDFTPTSSIGGFQFYNDGTEIVHTSVVRTNATHITGTLASTPSGTVKELWHCWGSIYNDAGSTIVRDNSAYNLPLHSGKWVVS